MKFNVQTLFVFVFFFVCFLTVEALWKVASFLTSSLEIIASVSSDFQDFLP